MKKRFGVFSLTQLTWDGLIDYTLKETFDSLEEAKDFIMQNKNLPDNQKEASRLWMWQYNSKHVWGDPYISEIWK